MSFKYWAFISYSSKDIQVAKRLQRDLEFYSIPKSFVGQTGRDGPIPRRLFPFFRDRDEFALDSSLSQSIQEALKASRYLIVICSPDAAQSKWVNEEIRYFHSLGRSNRIFAVICRGRPNASQSRTDFHEECYPAALGQFPGKPSRGVGSPIELLAGDLRPGMDGRRSVCLKTIAGITGIPYGDLVRRDEMHRRRTRIVSACIAVPLLLLVTVLFAQTNISRHQANQAEIAKRKSEADKALAEAAKEQTDYLSDMREIGELWKRTEVNRATDLLRKYDQKPELRNLEWHYWNRVLNSLSSQEWKLEVETPLSLAIDEESKRIAVQLDSGQVAVFDAATGKELYRFGSNVHRLLSTPMGWAVLPNTYRSQIEVFNYESGTPSSSRQAYLMISALAYSPATRTFAAGESAGNIWLHELSRIPKEPVDLTASMRTGLNFSDYSPDALQGGVNCLAFNQDGTRLAVGYESGAAQIWDIRDVQTANVISRWKPASTASISGIRFSPDGTKVAIQTSGKSTEPTRAGSVGEIYLWDPTRPRELWSHTVHAQPETWKKHPLDNKVKLYPTPDLAPVFSPNGQILYTTSDLAVDAWDVETGKKLEALAGHNGKVHSVAVSPLDGLIAGAGRDGTIRVWQSHYSATSKLIHKFRWLLGDLAISDDERHLAIGSRMATGDVIVNILEIGKRNTELAASDITVQPDSLLCLRYDPLRKKFVNFNRYGEAQLVSMSEFLANPPQKKDAKQQRSPEKRGLAAMLIQEKEIGSPLRDWSVRKTEPQGELELKKKNGTIVSLSNRPVRRVTFSRDNRKIAAGFEDGSFKVWNEAAEKLVDFTPKSGSDPVTAITLSDDARWLAVGTMRGTVLIMDAENGSEIAKCKGHRCEISAVRFNPAANRLVSSSGLASAQSSQAGEVVVWDVASGQRTLWLELSEPRRFADLTFNASGDKIYAIAGSLDSASHGTEDFTISMGSDGLPAYPAKFDREPQEWIVMWDFQH